MPVTKLSGGSVTSSHQNETTVSIQSIYLSWPISGSSVCPSNCGQELCFIKAQIPLRLWDLCATRSATSLEQKICHRHVSDKLAMSRTCVCNLLKSRHRLLILSFEPDLIYLTWPNLKHNAVQHWQRSHVCIYLNNQDVNDSLQSWPCTKYALNRVPVFTC